jgi:hypothetical protein
MSAAFIFLSLCAALVLVLSAGPTSRARADDNNDQGEDSCGSAMVGEDDDNQGDDNAQGDENGCGMVVVEVDDENGDVVDDMNDDGTPDDDVDVEVSEVAQSGVNTGATLTFHMAQNGSFVLKGLPKGRATIAVTRVHNGATTSRTRKAGVRELRTKHLRLRLRPPKM